jgi:hypothetical protein
VRHLREERGRAAEEIRRRRVGRELAAELVDRRLVERPDFEPGVD